MKEFPDKYFQLAIVDPPYGLDERLTSGGPLLQKRAMTALYKGKKWDSLPDASYFQELQRVSQAQIIWGG
jgi:site-specific DNA-methyltransferase (adenine-specific)